MTHDRIEVEKRYGNLASRKGKEEERHKMLDASSLPWKYARARKIFVEEKICISLLREEECQTTRKICSP